MESHTVERQEDVPPPPPPRRKGNSNRSNEEVEENGGKPIVEGDGKDKRLIGKELKLEYERIEKITGTKMTPSHYEVLRGLTSGTYWEKTHFELIGEEKLFLLRTDEETTQFLENDIVI